MSVYLISLRSFLDLFVFHVNFHRGSSILVWLLLVVNIGLVGVCCCFSMFGSTCVGGLDGVLLYVTTLA